jgi:hypothetical protein
MSTSKVIKYGVDLYSVKVNNGGTVVYDLGTGDFIIKGNLTVEGNANIVESSELVIADNTITVNSGELGAGVTLDTAGIIVDRGTAPDVSILFNENLQFLDSQTGGITTGAFSFTKATGDLVGIFTNNVSTLGNDDLILLQENTSAIVRVATARPTPYERTIWNYTANNITSNPLTNDRLVQPVDDGSVINARGLIDYVRAYHLYNFQSKISRSNTEVEVTDTSNGDAASQAIIRIDGSSLVTVNAVGMNLSTSVNLNKIADPAQPTDGVRLYSKNNVDGEASVFFINENGTRDELISKNKAFLYGLIF